jgi:hypothetical protein
MSSFVVTEQELEEKFEVIHYPTRVSTLQVYSSFLLPVHHPQVPVRLRDDCQLSIVPIIETSA